MVSPEDEVPGESEWEEDDSRYSWSDARPLVVPIVVISSVVVVILVGLHFIQGPDDDVTRLEDVDMSGTFTLDGSAQNPFTHYGPHVWSHNLTLRKGDTIVLRYTSSGPPEGIHVRLQHPLLPQQAEPVEVHASSAGANGSIDLVIGISGAYQVYIYHPGAARPPEDPDAHQYATVVYDLEVTRANRP
jgi:hypothetical protein